MPITNVFETELTAEECRILQGFIDMSIEKSDIMDAHYKRQSITPGMRVKIKAIIRKLHQKEIELQIMQN